MKLKIFMLFGCYSFSEYLEQLVEEPDFNKWFDDLAFVRDTHSQLIKTSERIYCLCEIQSLEAATITTTTTKRKTNKI